MVDKTGFLCILGFVHVLSAVHQLGAVFRPIELPQNPSTTTIEWRMLTERPETLAAICRNVVQDLKEEAPIYRSFPTKLFHLNNTKVELIKVPVKYKKRRSKKTHFS
jgi:hypothetical protein